MKYVFKAMAAAFLTASENFDAGLRLDVLELVSFIFGLMVVTSKLDI